PRLEVVKAWPSSDAARADLPGLRERIKWRAFGWYPAGPAAALAPMFRSWPETEEFTGQRVAEQCQGLAHLARARGPRHPGDPLLDAHVSAASKLPSGDGWRFTRKGEGHVDAAYAAAGAADLALRMPPVKRAGVRIIA